METKSLRRWRDMSTFVRVFCRRPSSITQADVAEFIRDGIFFGQPLTFEPSDAPERVGQADWENLSISYDRERRPIIVWRHSRGAILASDIAEALEVLSSADAPGVSDLVERLQNSSVVYAFEVSEDSLSGDAWTMLDALEAHLARTCDGIVHAPGDGFFDADLRPIAAS